MIKLLLCVGGIYASFLTWAYLQEKLTGNYSLDGGEAYIRAPLFLNMLSSFLSIVVGLFYLKVQTRGTPRKREMKMFPKLPMGAYLSLVLISVAQSISSPISYMALEHIDYVLYLLAKSCKLIPVMSVHFLIFGTIYPLYKYIVALVITSGVCIFSIGGKSLSLKGGGDVKLGMTMLLISLFLDGFVNSAQDMMFKNPRVKGLITGAHLMVYLNIMKFILISGYTLIFTNQIQEVLTFVKVNGNRALVDMLQFSLCGAFGQIAIFITLQEFSSVVLVTVAVTRKMISMLLSVIIFGHSLTSKQWVGLFLVFGGIFLESASKIFKPREKLKET